MLVGMGIVGVYSSESSAEGSTAVEGSEMGGEEMRGQEGVRGRAVENLSMI